MGVSLKVLRSWVSFLGLLLLALPTRAQVTQLEALVGLKLNVSSNLPLQQLNLSVYFPWQVEIGQVLSDEYGNRVVLLTLERLKQAEFKLEAKVESKTDLLTSNPCLTLCTIYPSNSGTSYYPQLT